MIEEAWELNLKISPFSGYSGIYTQDLMERIETAIRKMLDDELGYLNANRERNYEITRKDYIDPTDRETFNYLRGIAGV